MEVYIIRHGETIWNAAGKLQGHADIELNEKGRELAKQLGRELEGTAFDRIYSSPLKRAYETACLIRGERNIPVIRDDRLREISFGKMEGVHYSEWMDEKSPYRFFFEAPGKYIPPAGGESLAEVCERTRAFLQENIEAETASGERIMIVGHGAVNKGLMCHIEGHGIDTYWGDGLQKNCEATVFEYDGSLWRKIR